MAFSMRFVWLYPAIKYPAACSGVFGLHFASVHAKHALSALTTLRSSLFMHMLAWSLGYLGLLLVEMKKSLRS